MGRRTYPSGAALATRALPGGPEAAYAAGSPDNATWRAAVSKGMDRRKETKKKPAKSPQEKRAAKRDKQQGR
jgi:hypothetical protein